MRKFLKAGGHLLIPFFAFGLGVGINLLAILSAGLPGILLGLVTLTLGCVVNIIASRLAGGSTIITSLLSPLATAAYVKLLARKNRTNSEVPVAQPVQ
jgi:2-keto-3-deoxygluconate permease